MVQAVPQEALQVQQQLDVIANRDVLPEGIKIDAVFVPEGTEVAIGSNATIRMYLSSVSDIPL